MLKENITDLISLITVAKAGSFTHAAGQLGVSQSALSHSIRGLEERLGVRLLNRTTRKVTPTSAGERVLREIDPLLVQVQEHLEDLIEMRALPAGSFRITTGDHAADTLLWPKLAPILEKYPDLHIELVNDYGLTDIVAEKFDAGVRLGEHLADGMIAVRIGPDFRFIVVGSPAYIERQGVPLAPQQLTEHKCINLRLPTHGGIYAWEFEKGEHELRVRVEGQLTFNTIYPVIRAALDGYGLAYVPEDLVRGYLEAGTLKSVLDDWCPPSTGYFLYYPHRRHKSRAFQVIVEALRYGEHPSHHDVIKSATCITSSP
ncbi:MAG: LysR family transcriptional regulator [Thiolinea sp.]